MHGQIEKYLRNRKYVPISLMAVASLPPGAEVSEVATVGDVCAVE